MCKDFNCIYERGGLCLLDNDVCSDTCDRDSKCEMCENDCKQEETDGGKGLL